MVAARDLKAGEVLFRECAVVHGPKMLSHPICLGCHKTLNKFNLYRCSRCKWPMCAKACESLQPHIDECQLMCSKNYRCPIKTNLESVADGFYSLIFPLRFLLLKVKQPKTWVKNFLPRKKFIGFFVIQQIRENNFGTRKPRWWANSFGQLWIT
jgi:hypothetical protein